MVAECRGFIKTDKLAEILAFMIYRDSSLKYICDIFLIFLLNYSLWHLLESQAMYSLTVRYRKYIKYRPGCLIYLNLCYAMRNICIRCIYYLRHYIYRLLPYPPISPRFGNRRKSVFYSVYIYALFYTKAKWTTVDNSATPKTNSSWTEQ